jgi:membrane protein implicated in regulation of membrane protease activity
MSWEGFYLCCFLIGFFLSLISALSSSAHFHLPHHSHGTAHGGPGSFLNFGTFAAFLAWFGGSGFLLTRYSSIWTLIALGMATAMGVLGAALVFWFLFKVLLKHERDLDPADYDMTGVLGRISSTVRSGGTGEMIYSRNGVRRPAIVRSETGQAIPKAVEVVVTRFEKGIAYVRPWDEMSEARSTDTSKLKEN